MTDTDAARPGYDGAQGGASPSRPLKNDMDVRRWSRLLEASELGRILFDRLMEQSPADAARMLRLCGARITSACP